MTRTVLMNAGPWLPVPPDGYGGIENVVAALVPELRKRGIRVCWPRWPAAPCPRTNA